MKILHVIPALSRGGGAKALIALARQCLSLGGCGHSLVSLTKADPRSLLFSLREHGLDAVESPSALKIQRLVDSHDIVHLHFWNTPEIYDFLRSDLPPMRLVITMHIGGEHAPHVITRELVDFADRIQNVGPFAQDRSVFAELSPQERREKVRMTYCPADFSRIGHVDRRPHPGFNVLYIGTVGFVKLHPEFIDYCASVRIPGTRFVVCGPGDAYPVLKGQAANREILDRMDFLGERRDIRPLLETADVFGYPLCPDNYSSGELILQEIAHAGLPAVVLAHGGAARMVENGVSGFVVKSRSEYRDAVEHLLNHPEERERMGSNARRIAAELYAEGRAGLETMQLYGEMMRLPKRKRTFPQPEASGGGAGLNSAGASRFIQSLGHAATWFRLSAGSEDLEDKSVADGRIEASSPVLSIGVGGIADYLRRYPDDRLLLYWAGLTAMHRGQAGPALVNFIKASRLGLDQARVEGQIARAAKLLGEPFTSLEEVAGLAESDCLQTAPRPSGGTDPGKDFWSEWRQRMDVFLALGMQDKAVGLYQGLGRKTGFTPSALDALYRFGLACHKADRRGLAEEVYKIVAGQSALDGELAAWAHFKLGELCLERGDTDTARGFLLRTVELKPDHAKARILLVPESRPLGVSIGETEPPDGYVPIPMSLFDESLWEYFFSRRHPEAARLSLDPFFERFEAKRLAELLNTWCKPGARVTLVLPGRAFSDMGLRGDMEEIFRFLKLSVECDLPA